MLRELLDYDYSAIDLRTVPKTEALTRQKLLSLSPQEQWLFDKLSEGCLLASHGAWSQEVEKDDLYADYCETMKRTSVRHIISKSEMGVFLNKIFGAKLRTFRPNSKGRHWRFPVLEECRDKFEERFGSIKWEQDPPLISLIAVGRSTRSG